MTVTPRPGIADAWAVELARGWCSVGNETARNKTASTTEIIPNVQSREESRCSRRACMISGEHPNAPMPHAKFKRLTMPALFLPPDSAAERFVGGVTRPYPNPYVAVAANAS